MIPVYNSITALDGLAITIDDGPNPETTPLLLEVLDYFGLKANFFLTTTKTSQNKEIVYETIRQGHRIFSHGFNHVPYMTLSDDEIVQELITAENELKVFRPMPSSTYFIRLPYGNGADNERVKKIIHGWNSKSALVQWSSSPREWQIVGSCKLPSDIEKLSQIGLDRFKHFKLASSILLLHDWPKFIPNETPTLCNLRPYFCAALLEKICQHIKENKFNTYLL